MSKKKKLIQRLKTLPDDFTFQELKQVVGFYGFEELTVGKTTGSAVKFVNKKTGKKLYLHRPHPGNIVKRYILQEVLKVIGEEENGNE